MRVAAGAPLPKSQDQLQLNGHAIEARICAENPNQDFLPATGPLWHFSGPEASHFFFTAGGVRLDTGVTQGDVVSPFYDSMLAKLIVWGADRDEALAKLDKALSEMQVVGVANNVAFLRDVVQSASFSQGDLDTDLIARERDNLFKTQTLSEDLAVAGVMGMVLRQEVDAMGSNPWQAVDGWQVVGAPPRPFQLQGAWGDEVRALDVVLYSAPQRVRIADMDHAFEWRAHPRGVSVCLNGVWTDLSVVASAGQYHVFSRAGHAVLQWVDPLAGSAQAADALGGLNTPMPGKLIRMDVAVGDTVAKGQVLAVMEAMKMEHSIASPRDGVVSEVFYAVGDQVAEGQALLTLQDVT